MNKRSFLLCLFVSTSVLCGPARAAETPPSALVTLTRLQKGTLPQTLSAYGVAQPKPSATLNMMAPISVRIGKVFVQRGEGVDKDAALVELLPSPQTTAAWQQASSAYKVAQQLVQQTQRMRSQQLATAQQLADAKKSESDALAQLQAYKQQGADGPHVLRAPYPATVTELAAQPGALVNEGSPLLVLAKPEQLVLNVSVRIENARKIHRGDSAVITPIGEKDTLQGKVLMRAAIVDAASGLVPIQIGLASATLVPGQAAEAVITTGHAKGYLVPHQAILVDDQGKPYVVQARAMRARLVHVSVLGSNGDHDVIAGKGLEPSEPLVLSGNHQLQDGMPMRTVSVAGKPR